MRPDRRGYSTGLNRHRIPQPPFPRPPEHLSPILNSMFRALVGPAAGCLFCVLFGGAMLRAAAPVAQERLRTDLTVLASDDFEGRGIGTKGIDRAADYISDQFAK